MSIPLKARKAIKESIPECEKELQTAGAALGVTLSFVDTTPDIYNLIENKDSMTHLPEYFKNFSKVIGEAAKNPTLKEALVEKLNACGGKIALRPYVRADGEVERPYFSSTNESFNIDFATRHWGSWISSWDLATLEKCMTVNYYNTEMPLPVKKSIVEALPKIEAQMKIVSEALGAEKVEFDVDYGKLWTWLIEHKSNNNIEHPSNQAVVGDKLVDYATKIAKTVKEFCSDADNKEALVEAWTDKKIGIIYALHQDIEVPFSWKDGALYFQVKNTCWGTWIDSTFTPAALEKTL